METRERYDELCRLCASYDAVKMDIFGQEGKNRQLVDKIQTCLPFKIGESDRLPKCLCYRCMYNLENFYDFRTACINAVALLERCLPPDATVKIEEQIDEEPYSQLRLELLKKESMPVLIPEAPVVNPNAALGTPPRLNSDGEVEQELEEVVEHSGTDEEVAGADDPEDRKSDEYEMDMETNPSDFLEMPPMVTDDAEEQETAANASLAMQDTGIFQHRSEQHEVYVCSLCNKAFSSKGHLSLHARIHVGAGDVIGEKVITDDHTSYKRPYQCDLCNKSYSTAKHRWGHVSTTHRGHPAVTCGYCSRIYSTRTNLEEHVKSRHAGLPPPPELPGPYIQPETRHQCKTCPKMYTNVTDLNKHSRMCLGDPRKELTNSTPVQKMKVEAASDLSSIDSDYESRDYKNAEAKLAKNPQLTILKQALTKGDNMRREYDEKNKLTNKPKKQKGAEEADVDVKQWFCEVCKHIFTSMEDYREHEATHGDKPYVCILCEKDFALKSALSRHILTSHGVDPTPIIDSDKCLKKSASNQNATSATAIITKEVSISPFSPDNENLENDEEEVESGHENNMVELETVFVCEICTRDFNDRASLWLHIRATHKEYAAFACGVCLKICSDNAQLLNHVNMYHGGSKLLMSEQRRYSCTICGRQHDSRKKLITHVSIHNVDPGYDPASFVQLNSNYYNENLNSNEPHDLIMDCDPEEGERVDCYICCKSFPNEDHLIRHQRNAHKSEPMTPTGEFGGNGNAHGQNGNGNRAQYHLFFVCELCGSSHPSKWERWLHVSSTHSNEPSIRCERDDCAKIFATKSLRNEHAQHHMLQGSSPNTCEICGKLWGSRVDYWKHVMGVHSDTVPLICGVCLKVFPDVLQLSHHVKTLHWPLTNGDFSCDICGRPYSNKSKMSRHRKIHGLDGVGAGRQSAVNESYANHSVADSTILDTTAAQVRLDNGAPPQNELSCEMCGDLKFPCLEDLCNHRRMAHSLFPCDLCNKCYGRTSHLWKHVNRVHKGHEDVTCRYCSKTSASKDHLAAHIAKIHRYEPEVKRDMRDSVSSKSMNAEEEAQHHCEKCNKSFHKRYLLRRHMKGCQNYRKDPGALLTRCRACERIFKDRASLQKHIENHHSTYTCHLCNETITSKLGIMTHNRVHHMQHPDITCELPTCMKLFRTKEDLESHRKDHKYHGTPNVCDFCGDTVENKLKLKMHILSLHRNEIGVSCGVCLIPMKDPKDLKKHVEDVHESILQMPNTCKVCGKQYASKWKAFDHTKKCHGKVFRTCKQCLAVFTSDDDLKSHYEHVHNVPKDQLAAFEYRLEIGPKGDEYDPCEVVVKEEPDELDFDDEPLDDDSNESKRRRSMTDTYDCEICPEIFLNHDTLSSHYKNVHNTDPTRMFKKMKLDKDKAKRQMRDRENFECKNCLKQFCTKTLFWNHINVCTRRNTPMSILEAHLKNNNQVKNEQPEPEPDPMLTETNLNIPDFNLFEDINMQLSGQKPLPSLMPLMASKSSSGSKCSRKDSRKVYDESTNTECACEVCGKQWPAKKHLWQHLIRFHRAEAAVTCGVCLKLCTTYTDLGEHLKAAHQAILSTEGNNFTCKVCGRYHNARSKLLLHMSIHINCSLNTWCYKCQKNLETQEKLQEHAPVCMGKQPRNMTEHSNEGAEDSERAKNDADEKGSFIGDETSMIGDAEEVGFDSDDDASENGDDSNSDDKSDSDSDSDSSSDDDDDDDDDDDKSRSNSRSSSCSSDSDDSNNVEMSGENQDQRREETMSIGEDENSDNESEKKESGEAEEEGSESPDKSEAGSMDYSDDEGPPVLSPIMPLLPKEDEPEESSEEEEEEEEEEENEENGECQSENEGEVEEVEIGELEEETQVHAQVLEVDANQVHDMNGTVLMLANDADGNQILIERNMSELADEVSGQELTQYVYQDGGAFELEDYEAMVEDQRLSDTGLNLDGVDHIEAMAHEEVEVEAVSDEDEFGISAKS